MVRMGAEVKLCLSLECLLSLQQPVELHLCGRKSIERGSYCAEASDEQPVKVSKPQELLNLVAAVSCRPSCHSANFGRIHLHSSRSYNEAQEGDGVGMKHTFLALTYKSLSNSLFKTWFT